MEEEPQLSTQVNNNDNEDDRGGDDEEEFYEKIEAPKFVDFTAPDPYRPDDRYWFCLRVGCDQKHEEEIDPEAISKNFFLRVMAARSPYMKLQKILNRKANSMSEQCPLSAPAKPSKSRASRLALMRSSGSRKMIDPKGKIKPLSKLSSTPNAKAKQVAARYLTTPRNKNCLRNKNSFRSVQNPKPTSVAAPKNRTIAKALVFRSPKKSISIKTSSELRTPLTKICQGMKRLEITSQRKRVLGYSNKSSKDIRRDPNKSLPADPSRRQRSACKDKSKAKELFKPPNCKDQETKSLRQIKKKSKGNLNKPRNSMPKEMVENESSDMEIDIKSRDGSVLGSSRITKGNVYEEQLTTEKTSRSFDSMDSTQEEAIPCLEVAPSTKNSDGVLSDSSGGEMNSSSNSEEEGGCLEENDFSKFQALNQISDGSSEGVDQEDKTKATSEKRGSPDDHLTESRTLEEVGHEGEAMDSDDKENALASDGNRDLDHNKNHSGRKILGKQETNEISNKVTGIRDKNLKEALAVAAAGVQGVKYRKPKPTTPKPFRLRTDERGILKEANLERRIQSLVPQKETATVSLLPGGIFQKRHGNDIQRNEKCLEQSKCNHDTHESSRKESEKSFQKDEPNQSGKADLRTSEQEVRPKIATTTPQRHSNSTQQKPKPALLTPKSLRKTKSSSLQGQFIRPKGGVASTKQAMGSYLKCGKQLSVIKETPSTASRSEDPGEPSRSENGLANKATTSAASIRSLSRGKKRPATIPKEPNFHRVHVPKSCIRKVT